MLSFFSHFDDVFLYSDDYMRKSQPLLDLFQELLLRSFLKCSLLLHLDMQICPYRYI